MLFFGEPIDHISPAANHVTDNATPGLPRESVEQVSGKTIRVCRERFRQVYSGYFPVTAGAVLTSRRRSHTSPRTCGVPARLHSFERFDIAEAESLQSREF